jgi:hypothetical protein
MHFYTTATNSRGKTVSAEGTKDGQETWIRGWSSGVEVIAKHYSNHDLDEFEVYATDGPKGSRRIFLGVVKNINGEPVFTPRRKWQDTEKCS